jgi:succinyl-diaminopimelate desuccinylase
MYQEQIEAYFAKKESDLVAAISRLVRIPSVKGPPSPGMPFGEGPYLALSEALDLARELGLSAKNLDGYVGVADINDKETNLDILAHLDVVEPGPGWTVTDPFDPKLIDGLLYGRGTSDDKGPLVAALFAMKAIHDLEIPLSHNVRLIMGTDEESGFADIHWYYENYPYAPYTFSPDASFPLTNLEKGHFQPFLRKSWFEAKTSPQVISLTGSPQINVVPPKAEALITGLSLNAVQPYCQQMEQELAVTFSLSPTEEGLSIICTGQGTHASTPEEGNNALTALITFLSRLPLAACESTQTLQALQTLFPHGDHTANALNIAQSDSLSGPLTLTLTMMNLSPSGMEARFDCRTPRCATEENCLFIAKNTLQSYGIELEGHINPAHYVPEESPFVQNLLRCYEQYTGQKGTCISTGGGTYVHDIPGGVAYGACMPGFDSCLHGPDERVSILDLLTACKIFTQAIIDLCK